MTNKIPLQQQPVVAGNSYRLYKFGQNAFLGMHVQTLAYIVTYNQAIWTEGIPTKSFERYSGISQDFVLYYFQRRLASYIAILSRPRYLGSNKLRILLLFSHCPTRELDTFGTVKTKIKGRRPLPLGRHWKPQTSSTTNFSPPPDRNRASSTPTDPSLPVSFPSQK